MKPIQAWETTDGRVFSDEGEACDHENTLRRKKAVTALVDKFFASNMFASEVVEEILEHREDLLEALK
jgi:hypothetical protein